MLVCVHVFTCIATGLGFPGGGDLKRQELNRAFLTKAESGSAAMSSVRIIRCVFSIKPCKPILALMKLLTAKIAS